MSRLTKVQKVYILNADETPAKIAKTLGIELSKVENLLKKNEKEKTQAEAEKVEQPGSIPEINPGSMPADERFIKTGLAGKDGAIVMTQAGSEKGDLIKNKRADRKDCIHKI